MEVLEKEILSRLIIDESSPSGLRWNCIPHNRKSGKPAGSLNKTGYWHVKMRINGKLKAFQAHRLVWFLSHESWPVDQIDHINNDKEDNRLVNLRVASNGENNRNVGISNRNTSSVKGVSFNKARCKWEARVMHDGKQFHAGYFAEISDAECAIVSARERLHGKFANHGNKSTVAHDDANQ